MSELVSMQLDEGIAAIHLDDGKVNCLSPRMIAAVNAALDQAEEAGAVVLLTGREGKFSAGFDLSVIQAGGNEARDMLTGGFLLAAEQVLPTSGETIAAAAVDIDLR